MSRRIHHPVKGVPFLFGGILFLLMYFFKTHPLTPTLLGGYILFSLWIFAWIVSMKKYYEKMLATGMRVTATVTANEKSTLTYQFPTVLGETFLQVKTIKGGRVEFSKKDYPIGKKLEVIYASDRPSKNWEKETLQDYIGICAVAIRYFALVAFLLLAVFAIHGNNR